MLDWCWSTVYDDGPTSSRLWSSILCLLGACPFSGGKDTWWTHECEDIIWYCPQTSLCLFIITVFYYLSSPLCTQRFVARRVVCLAGFRDTTTIWSCNREKNASHFALVIAFMCGQFRDFTKIQYTTIISKLCNQCHRVYKLYIMTSVAMSMCQDNTSPTN